MTSRDFCYWLQGYLELNGADAMSQGQVRTMANHLALVFKHEIDPSFGDEKAQKILDKIHNVGSPPPPAPGPLGVKYRC